MRGGGREGRCHSERDFTTKKEEEKFVRPCFVLNSRDSHSFLLEQFFFFCPFVDVAFLIMVSCIMRRRRRRRRRKRRTITKEEERGREGP